MNVSVTIGLEDGEWQVEPLPATGRSVGLDWGVKAVASTTAGPESDLPHTPHRDRAQRALGRYQRQMARRRPTPGKAASNGYRTAKRHTAREHAKIAARRQDEARKWALKLDREFDQIAIEDFKPLFMFGSTLAARAASARTAAARRAFTTMDCSNCGARAKHRLPPSQRTFQCEVCGHTADRDANAAGTVRLRAFGPEARAGFDPAGADRVRPVGAPDVPLAA